MPLQSGGINGISAVFTALAQAENELQDASAYERVLDWLVEQAGSALDASESDQKFPQPLLQTIYVCILSL